MNEKPPGEQHHICIILTTNGMDPRRYNLPNDSNEIAAIIPGNGSEDVKKDRDIVLHWQDGRLEEISNLHPLYAPLHYVLLFPSGEYGWHPRIPIHVGAGGGRPQSKFVSE